MPAVWHSLGLNDVFRELGGSRIGLTRKEVLERRKVFGLNEIRLEKKLNPLKMFLEQFKSFLVLILLVASAALFFLWLKLGEFHNLVDAVLIFLLVLLNGVFGFVQNYKSEKGVQELKKMASPKTLVLRNNVLQRIDSTELVPGDVVQLEEGDLVPADLRCYASAGLEVDESILTGESMPVNKKDCKLSQKTVLAERRNLLFANTRVVRGKTRGIVLSTALSTEVGKIASQLQQIHPPKTVFERELDSLGKKIGLEILLIIALISLIQFFFHPTNLIGIAVFAIALAVAAIPEGLPAVVTLSLAIGTQKMMKRNSLVRRLSVVESLGSVDVICSDKTGTLTEGKMKAKTIYFFDHFLGAMDGFKAKESLQKEFDLLMKAAVLCNNAKFVGKELAGDYTEMALVEMASHANYRKTELDEKFRRVKEIAFSYERKRMTSLNMVGKEQFAFMKGATEVVLRHCSQVLENGELKPLSKEKIAKVKEREDNMASSALRVLGFAVKKIESKGQKPEDGMIFLGMVGIADSPRRGVKRALEACRDAGIKVKMITGDKALTALAIAKQIGIGEKLIESAELEKLSGEELRERVEETDIFARVEPKHKVKILKALQANGHIVAMTGDGVNDAPALKNADVGIAMGLRGTEVAKESSDLVLLDDHFNSIVEAVKQGRTIFANIRKFVNYLLTSNFAEVFVIFIASLFGLLPITPVQLLLINFITDGMPALALGVDPPSQGIMKRKPKPKSEGVINKRMAWLIGLIGAKKTLIILVIFYIGLSQSLEIARTMLFAGFILYEFNRIAVIRFQEKLGFFSNKWLVVAMAGSIALLFVFLYTPVNYALGLVPLSLSNWVVLAVGVGVGWFGAIATTKAVVKYVG